MKQAQQKTSWESVHRWYDKAVGVKGHYYHEHIVLPNVLKLLALKNDSSLLDLACGQGILSRKIPKEVRYLGIDAAPSLISSAKERSKNPLHSFTVADICRPITIKETFSHVSILLALQNLEHPKEALLNAYHLLKSQGKLVVVLNHPCFRIPRQSSWMVDEEKKIQYRRIDRYQSSMKIPIQAHPSQGTTSSETWSFHYSLAELSAWIQEAGFSICRIDEWCSDKVSTGAKAKMENRSREEIPLFMALVCKKD